MKSQTANRFGCYRNLLTALFKQGRWPTPCTDPAFTQWVRQLSARVEQNTPPPKKRESFMSNKITMKAAIERILSGLGQLEAFTSNHHFAIKIQSGTFMPLSIERHGEIISVTHYFEQSGDLILDPDMEFLELKTGRKDWLPVAIQHSTGSHSRAGENVGGTWKFDAKTMRDLESFSRVWARNLIDQGFPNGVIKYAKAG